MTTPFVRTRIATAVAGAALALCAGQAFGTGFQLNEQSASSMGNAFGAGAASPTMRARCGGTQPRFRSSLRGRW